MKLHWRGAPQKSLSERVTGPALEEELNPLESAKEAGVLRRALSLSSVSRKIRKTKRTMALVTHEEFEIEKDITTEMLRDLNIHLFKLYSRKISKCGLRSSGSSIKEKHSGAD